MIQSGTLSLCLLALLFLSTSCESDKQRPTVIYTMGDPVESGSRYSYLTSDESDRVFMSWLLSIEEELYAIQFASFEGVNWNEPETVIVSSDLFVNWADFPSIVSREGEPVAIHWLKKIEGGGPYAYDVQVAFRSENGRWETIVTPHEDGTETEHGFVSMVAPGRDRVLAIWLDGRNTEGRAHDEYGDPGMAMTLRSAEISQDGTVSARREVDGMVCDCCPTDLVEVEGGALAVYRNRTEDEIRDIAIARYDYETQQWSDPAMVHEDGWQISGCPVNGPAVDALGDRVAVAWFTEEGGDQRVLLARSEDGGMQFEEPLRIDHGTPMGRVDVKYREDGTLYLSWMEQEEGMGRIYLRELTPEGELLPPVRIGNTDQGRRSGFPKLVMSENGIIFSWTQTDPVTRVRNAYYPFEL
ncbi:MAG: hypothetical protein WD355_06925 [Balneolaceae bacterium]